MAAGDGTLVLGTAGHIDHGKSALVQALTGTNPDRLAEERRRGITIELGFAQLVLSDGTTASIVDVPGHERFVKQMIAGATGVDAALLVIAADDGVMPQTIEHIAVLQTLGVARMAVALSKIDLVDADWVAFMVGEVRAALAETPYAQAPIVPVSAKTGVGLDELKAALVAECAGIVRTRADRGVRLPIDRAFTIKGAGTVVTGTLWSGEVRAGDTVELQPRGVQARVRGVQTHGEAMDGASAGSRVALNLAGVTLDEVRAGDFVCAPGACVPTDRFDAQFTYLDTRRTGRALVSGARLHVAHGTREVLGRVLFCNGKERLLPGESCFAQIRLEGPLAVCRGDRFVVRTYSPVAVAGGGGVLLAHPRRRTTLSADEEKLLCALAADNVACAAEIDVRLRSLPLAAENVARFLDASAQAVATALEAAVAAGRAAKIETGEVAFYTTPAALSRIMAALSQELIKFHAASPNAAGMPKRALAEAVAKGASDACFDALLAHAIATNAAVAVDGLVGHPSASSAAQAAVKDAAEKLTALLNEAGVTPPTLTHAAERLGVDMTLARKAAAFAEQEGALVRVASDFFFGAQVVEAAREKVAAYLRDGRGATAAELKEVIGASRKYVVPLLERFDAMGFTVRDGDIRTLKE